MITSNMYPRARVWLAGVRVYLRRHRVLHPILYSNAIVAVLPPIRKEKRPLPPFSPCQSDSMLPGGWRVCGSLRGRVRRQEHVLHMGGRKRRVPIPVPDSLPEVLVLHHYFHELRANLSARHAGHGQNVSVKIHLVGQRDVPRGPRVQRG